MDEQRGFVVVVDDDHRMREALEDLLESAGYKVLAFPSAERFLESHAISTTNCVISDIRMPGMNGLEFKERIESLKPNLPFLLITAELDSEHIQELANSRPRFCFTKPINCKSLLAAVCEAARE